MDIKIKLPKPRMRLKRDRYNNDELTWFCVGHGGFSAAPTMDRAYAAWLRAYEKNLKRRNARIAAPIGPSVYAGSGALWLGTDAEYDSLQAAANRRTA